MIRGTTLVCAVMCGLASLAGRAAAQTIESSPQVPTLSSALPGGPLVGLATEPVAGEINLAWMMAWGQRTGLLSANHKMQRFGGELAFAYAPLRHVIIGISLDGRYDQHTGYGEADSGLVGEPRLFLRGGGRFGPVVLSGTLGIFVPGDNAPSVKLGATSVDALALATVPMLKLAGGELALTLQAGYRLDNSAKSVANRSLFSATDQVSLGVSTYNALLVGGSAVMTHASWFVGGEGSADVFVGTGKPTPSWRAGVFGGYWLAEGWALGGFASVGKTAGVTAEALAQNQLPALPYDPTLTIGLGAIAQFGGNRQRYMVRTNAGLVDVQPTKKAVLRGKVIDDAGQPVVGAHITVVTALRTGTAATDSHGLYEIGELPIGNAEVSIVLDGKKPASTSLVLVEGLNTQAELRLDSVLLPGELRGVVRSQAKGRPVEATIKVRPGDHEISVSSNGTFQLPLPPGTYTAEIAAPGYVTQTLQFTIDPEAVVIKNIDLRAKR